MNELGIAKKYVEEIENDARDPESQDLLELIDALGRAHNDNLEQMRDIVRSDVQYPDLVISGQIQEQGGFLLRAPSPSMRVRPALFTETLEHWRKTEDEIFRLSVMNGHPNFEDESHEDVVNRRAIGRLAVNSPLQMGRVLYRGTFNRVVDRIAQMGIISFASFEHTPNSSVNDSLFSNMRARAESFLSDNRITLAQYRPGYHQNPGVENLKESIDDYEESRGMVTKLSTGEKIRPTKPQHSIYKPSRS